MPFMSTRWNMAAASAMTSATIGAALAIPTAGSRHGGSLCIVYVSEACNSPRLHSLFSCLGLNLEIHEEQNKAVPDHIAQSLFPLQYSPSKSHAMSTLQDNKRQVYNSGLVHSFVDFQYNRSSFYFLGERATQQALTLCNAAFEMLDFADHEGSHPTLGVVDHISFSPIGDESIERTQSIANEFCAQLSGAHPDLSVCCYGHLDPSHVRLQHLRRSLGYFQHDYKQALFTAIKESDKDLPSARFGPQLQPPSSFLKHKGLTCVGVVPWVQNFNVKFASHHKKSDITPITQAVRCPEVEALTLLHEDGAYEIACNLLQPRLVGRDIVLQRIQDLVLSEKQRSGEELVLESWYTTGPDEDELLRRSSLSRTAVDS